MSNEGNEEDQFFTTLLTHDRLKMGLCYVPATTCIIEKNRFAQRECKGKQSSQFVIAVI